MLQYRDGKMEVLDNPLGVFANFPLLQENYKVGRGWAAEGFRVEPTSGRGWAHGTDCVQVRLASHVGRLLPSAARVVLHSKSLEAACSNAEAGAAVL